MKSKIYRWFSESAQSVPPFTSTFSLVFKTRPPQLWKTNEYFLLLLRYVLEGLIALRLYRHRSSYDVLFWDPWWLEHLVRCRNWRKNITLPQLKNWPLFDGQLWERFWRPSWWWNENIWDVRVLQLFWTANIARRLHKACDTLYENICITCQPRCCPFLHRSYWKKGPLQGDEELDIPTLLDSLSHRIQAHGGF